MFTLCFRRTLCALLLICLPAISVSCMGGSDQKALDELDKLIEMVNNQPGLWQSAANGTITTLGNTGGKLAKEVTNDLQGLISTTLADSQAAVDCEQDKIGIRFKQELETLRKQINPKAPDPEIFPVICTLSTHEIEEGNSRIIGFNGIHFQEYIKNGQDYHVDIQYADGTVPKPDFRQVSIATDYLLQINLTGADWSGLDQNKDPRLVLKWGNKKVPGNQSEIPVVLSHTRTLYSVPDATFIYPLTGNGAMGIETTINANISMPEGCELQKTQVIYKHNHPGFEFPPIDNIHFGNVQDPKINIDIEPINPTDPKYLGMTVNLGSLDSQTAPLLVVKAVYTVKENPGVDCSVPKATSDAP